MDGKLIFYILGSFILILILAYICFHNYVNLFVVAITGKKRVERKLYKGCKENDFLIIKHLDAIIFGNKYIYIVSIVKNAGEVKVSLTDQKWRIVYNNELSLINNPFVYNEKVMHKLADVVEGLEYSDMKSLVVLTKTCSMDKASNSNKEFIALENDAINLILDVEKNSDEDIIDPFEIERYAKAFYDYGLECEKKMKLK